ncbi:MAG: protein-L-isoaspartate O-methyltransferase [Methyloligella sp.]|nr:MAG: protein-L-isoaspartate O-methyltransferase [Methyloligella sp.]
MTNFSDLRRNMVDCQLRPNDITSLRILEAMDQVPRELFVPDVQQSTSYADREIQLVSRDESRGPRSMLTPMALGSLLEVADIEPTDYILDVGCLTGYSSAVLAHLAESVVAVEAVPEMVKKATDILSDLEIVNVAVVEGGLAQGQANQGPYDVILVNGAVEQVPTALTDQLKDGGRLVTVVIENGYGRAERFVRTGGVVSSVSLRDLSAPVLSDFSLVPEFSL